MTVRYQEKRTDFYNLTDLVDRARNTRRLVISRGSKSEKSRRVDIFRPESIYCGSFAVREEKKHLNRVTGFAR